jgi:hypothetical protein
MVSEALALGSRLRALEEMLMRNSPPSRNTSGKVSRPEEGSPGSGKAEPWSERCGGGENAGLDAGERQVAHVGHEDGLG